MNSASHPSLPGAPDAIHADAWSDSHVARAALAGCRPGATTLTSLIPHFASISDMPIAGHALAARARRTLEKCGICVWRDLRDLTITELRAIKGVGPGTVIDLLKCALWCVRFLGDPWVRARVAIGDLSLDADQVMAVPECILSAGRKRRLRELFPSLATQSQSVIDNGLLASRTSHCLARQEISRWGDLLEYTVDNLRAIPGMGEASVRDLLQNAAWMSAMERIGHDVEVTGEQASTVERRDHRHLLRERCLSPDVARAIGNIFHWSVRERSATTIGDVCELVPVTGIPDDIARDWATIRTVELSSLIDTMRDRVVARYR